MFNIYVKQNILFGRVKMMSIIQIHKKINFINLTPHNITILRNNRKIEIKPSGFIARVEIDEYLDSSLSEKLDIDVYYVTPSRVVIEGNNKKYEIRMNEDMINVVHEIGDPRAINVLIVSHVVFTELMKMGISWRDQSYIIVVPNTNPQHVIRDKNGKIIGVDSFQIPLFSHRRG